ncbi:hypothetical protein [Actinoplanes sp. RD1]|uniref:hypothetical protein n=1 Tax=Actinoplanes sp. RD1 TaxID=3064538 RepID=UPI0027409EF2|nr:hypothetical protein [Actinoplanes sp. RD1]
MSQALASHHLRQLAKYGFIEPGPAGDNRERPWQVVSTSHDFRAAESDGEGQDAVELLDRYMAEQALAQLTEWQERRADEDPRWTELAGTSQSLLYLTIDEVADLRRAMDDLFTRWVRERPIGEPGKRPADAVPVNVTTVLTPLRPTASGG